MPDALRLRTFQLILTNPPFGKRIPAKNRVLTHFDLGKDEAGNELTKGSVLTEVLFLERDLEWLAPGGKLFIVLPDSVLGNATLGRAREFVERQARMIAVVSLPADTFGPSGAKSKTSFVVFEKRNKQLEPDEYDEYDVFVGVSHHVGYDFTGRETGKSDLSDIVKAYKEGADSVDGISAKTVKRSEFDSNWLAQAFFVNAGSSDGDEFIKLSTIADMLTGKTAPRAEYLDDGIHLVKVGNLTGRGIEWGSVERQYVSQDFARRYARASLRGGDILFTAAAHGPKWIGLKVDIFEEAPDFIRDPVLYCGEIMRVRLKDGVKIDPYYILMFLRSNAGYSELQRCIRGQSGHVYPDEVGDIRIPNPRYLDMKKIKATISSIKGAETNRAQTVETERQSLLMANAFFPSSTRKPIIAL